MDDQNIKTDINAIVEQSPVQRQIQAIKGVKFPEVQDGTSTLVTGDIEGNVADVYQTTPERGVEFTPNTTEVYTGGIASPKGKYNTRPQTPADRGNPLYFEPNYQAVAPYTFNTPAGPVESTTLDSQKLAWQIVTSNGFDSDRNYLGYRKVPDIGRLSWWSFAVNSSKGALAAAPYRAIKGAENVTGTVLKGLGYTLGPLISASVDVMNNNPESIVGDVIRSMNVTDDSSTGILFDTINTMMDAFNDAVDPIEQGMIAGFEADPEDDTFRAMSGRGFGDGVTSFGLAAMAGANADVAFTLLNFANANTMRKQAVDAGLSPAWAEAYGAVAPTLNSWLDIISFNVYMDGLSSAAASGADLLKKYEKQKLFRFLDAVVDQGIDTSFEIGTEMVQEAVEGAFDPEFHKRPLDRLAVAGFTAAALKAATLPVAVRHARGKEQLELARYYGVEGRLAFVRNETKKLVESWAKQGRINNDQKQILMDKIISEAPDQIINDLKTTAKGQLDKISPEDRAELARFMQNIKPEALSAKEFAKLDKNVGVALTGFNVPDSQKEMIKGVVRGLAQMKLVQDGTPPSQLNVPRFELTNDPEGSSYNPKTNTIQISTVWSDTRYNKGRNSPVTSNREDFRNYIAEGFIPSSSQSDRMSSIIHEMGHWIDYAMGEKGFTDFLEHYYNNIAKVFGDERALAVYRASSKGLNRTPDGKMLDTANKNATEWNAQALARLGKRAAEQMGLGRSQANRFISYANTMFNQIGKFEGAAGKRAATTLGKYQTAIQDVIDQNARLVADLVEVYGTDKLKKVVQDFINDTGPQDMGMTEYLAQQNMLRDLYNVMDTFADSATLEKVNDVFDSTEEANNFITAGDMYFRSGYDNAVAEIKEKRAQAAAKAAEKSGQIPAAKQASNSTQQTTMSDGTTATLVTNKKGAEKEGQPNFDNNSIIDSIKKLLAPSDEVKRERVPIYTGTPYIYDVFDLSKARSASGLNFHGHGLYFATDKDMAKSFWHETALRNSIIPISVYFETKDGKSDVVELRGNENLYSLFRTLYSEAKEKAIEKYTWYDGYGEYLDNEGYASELFTVPAQRIINKFKDAVASSANTNPDDILRMATMIDDDFGQLIKALSPDTDHMLNDRIKLEDQTEYVRNAVEKIRPLFERWANTTENPRMYKNYFNGDGEDLYYALRTMFEYTLREGYNKAQESASRVLSNLGIDGLVYEGGEQMVVWTPAALDILEKIRGVENIENAERIPNDYITDTDPAADIRQSYEQGKGEPIDEEPSYNRKIDGRTIGEDIDSLIKGIGRRAKARPNKVVKWAASSPWGWGLDRIVTTMFGREASEQLDIAGKYTKRNALRSNMYAKFMHELAPIVGDVSKDKTSAMFKYKTMLNNLGFVRVKGVEINNPYNSDITSTRDLTGWEVAYVYLMKRMGPKYASRIQQSTKTDINELIATLSKEEKLFADAMSRTLYNVWVGIVGPEKAVRNYFPILDAGHALLDEINIDTFKERMETNSPIAIDDAGRIFSKDISRIASWQSDFYQTLKRLRDVLQYKGAEGRNIDPEVDNQLKKTSALLAGQISDVFGRDAYHNLLRLLDTQIADPQDQMLDSSSSKTLQQMGSNVIKGMLSFKFLSFPKNLANITMMWGGAYDPSTYFNKFAEGVGNMPRTWKYMMSHSDEIRMRYNDASYNEFLDQRNTGGSTAPIFKGVSKLFADMNWTGEKTGGMAKMSAALDMMGDAGLKLFMLNGDAVANVYGGYGLIKDYMAHGLNEEQAFKKLDRYIVEHQSSSNLAMKPLGQLQANKSLAGQVMAFTSEGVVKGASILGTFDEVKMGTATMSQAIANAMSIAMSMLLFTAIAAGAWDLWNDDEKVRDEALKSLEGAMIDQLFGWSVLGNGFLTPAIQGMLGLGGNMGISAPLWSFTTEGITNLKKGEYDRITAKALEATGTLVGANSLYNDMLGMMFLNSDDPDVREAGFRMLAGRTMGYAEKRTGAKIKDTEDENVENSDEE